MVLKWYPEFITDIDVQGGLVHAHGPAPSALAITYNFVRGATP
jgi:hypothetical protein